MGNPSFATTLARARREANTPAKLEGRIDPEVLSRLMEYEAMMAAGRKVSELGRAGFLGESDFDRRYREIIDAMPPAKTETKQTLRIGTVAALIYGAGFGLLFGLIACFVLKIFG